MGQCKYCGQSAGFFSNKHIACEQRYKDGVRQIVEMASRGVLLAQFSPSLKTQIDEVAGQAHIPFSERQSLVISGWKAAVDHFLQDGVLDEKEERQLMESLQFLAVSKEELERAGALARVVKAGALRDILNGEIPQRIRIDGSLPFNFQRGEQLVWAFPDTAYLEDRTRRAIVGRSQGVSVRVMKGVYYRVGAFEGHPVERTERVHVDAGVLAVTNKNLYFAGPKKSLRLPYGKIVTFMPFSDGIGTVRDTATAKSQFFITGDGWFTYNLVTNLAKL